MRKIGLQFCLKFITILVWLVLLSSTSYGCSVCFGAPNTPLTFAMGWAIWFLLGLVVAVLFSIAAFVGYLAYKAKQARAKEALINGEGLSHA